MVSYSLSQEHMELLTIILTFINFLYTRYIRKMFIIDLCTRLLLHVSRLLNIFVLIYFVYINLTLPQAGNLKAWFYWGGVSIWLHFPLRYWGRIALWTVRVYVGGGGLLYITYYYNITELYVVVFVYTCTECRAKQPDIIHYFIGK